MPWLAASVWWVGWPALAAPCCWPPGSWVKVPGWGMLKAACRKHSCQCAQRRHAGRRPGGGAQLRAPHVEAGLAGGAGRGGGRLAGRAAGQTTPLLAGQDQPAPTSAAVRCVARPVEGPS